ncbi:hypothetical protein [Mesoterricola silvestris]|uniref:Uncharacterized protein n=1 Tax=Mesoterricola silvestris TaxID=2927979 RepID=A0AA48GSG9_9BACT|nr:hypothetical protein [Mesoterricola silvestris]BDU73440.1 hypothetical protein METEAL_26140 [Mesoterricola silvestris]
MIRVRLPLPTALPLFHGWSQGSAPEAPSRPAGAPRDGSAPEPRTGR